MIVRVFVIGMLVFCFAGAAAAQSGRRVKSAPAPPPVQASSQTTDTDDSVGYSESAPNGPRTLSPSTNSSKDKKSKKDTKTQNQSSAPVKPADPAPDSSGGEEVVKVETNLITIPVSVYGRTDGLYIPNLRQTDFKIFEDGKEQEVAYFGTSDKPFTVILLIDVSPSTAYKIEEIQAGAMAFVDQLKPEDKVMVISFDSSVNTLIKEPTNDRQKIYKAIHSTGFGNGTSLYEAVDTSIRQRLSKIEGRKAIVLFTDGVDTTSLRASYEKTVREAEESEAVIFPIYYNTFFGGAMGGGVMNNPTISGMPFPGSRGSGAPSADYALGRSYLSELAAATGGRVYRPESTPGGLSAAFEGIAEELRSQYNIGYYPQTEGASGERRQIKVRVNRPNLVVRARDSYIVGSYNKMQATN